MINSFATNKTERTAALKSYQLLDTEEELVYDQLTLLASQICGTKISLITLIDENRAWFKSHVGLKINEVPREFSICNQVISDKQALVINDLRNHPRYAKNPLVTGAPHISFYAGIPLTDNEGHSLGSLCVLDENPKQLTDLQLRSLHIVASQVIAQFRLRRELIQKKNYEDQLTRLTEQVPGFIYQYRLFSDGSSHFPFASEGIKKIYELTPEEVRLDAGVVFQRIHPEDFEQSLTTVYHSAKNLDVCTNDYRVILPKAGLRWLRGIAKPEKLPDGSILWHGFITDVTDEKNLEVQLYQNAKLAALGEMASGVAHEINNPLSIIIGKSSLLASNLASENWNREKIVRDIAKIETTALRISKIIKGLTVFSRNAEHDSFSVIPVRNIIEDTLSLVNEKFKYRTIDVVVECPDELTLECNATQIGQVLMNLLINSFDAIKRLDTKWIKIEVKGNGNSVCISVSDSGNGISPKIAEKIMEPFFTTKSVGEGTGLGLSLSKSLIESHNGKLKYMPSAKHTTFQIELPLRANSVMKNAA